MKRKPISTLELCDRASQLLKKVGFILDYTSMKTEACYYRYPEKWGLIRVAAHKVRAQPVGLGPIVAKITFNVNIHDTPGMMRIADEKFQNTVAVVIGRYFIATSKDDQT